MGPFELIDTIGADVNLAVSQIVYEAFGRDPRYRPHAVQRDAGRCGAAGTQDAAAASTTTGPMARAAHRGPACRQPPVARSLRSSERRSRARVLATIVNEAASAVEDGVAAPEAIDTAMRLGRQLPDGPLEWGERIGLARGRRRPSTRCSARRPDGRYRVVPLLRSLAESGGSFFAPRAAEPSRSIGFARSSSTWTACCSIPRCSGTRAEVRLFERHGAAFTFEDKLAVMGTAATFTARLLRASGWACRRTGPRR